MKSKKIVVQNIDDSISLYDNNILIRNYKPQYNLKKIYEYFDNIIKLSLNKIKLFKYNKVYYSLKPLFFQPIFWYVSFNIINYKEFFDQYGFHIPSKDLNEEVRNSYKRAVIFYRNDNLVRKLIVNLRFIKSHVIMILWIIISVLRKKENQIWIDKFIITNYRYNHPNLKKIINDSIYLEVLNRFSSPTAYSYSKKIFLTD